MEKKYIIVNNPAGNISIGIHNENNKLSKINSDENDNDENNHENNNENSNSDDIENVNYVWHNNNIEEFTHENFINVSCIFLIHLNIANVIIFTDTSNIINLILSVHLYIATKYSNLISKIYTCFYTLYSFIGFILFINHLLTFYQVIVHLITFILCIYCIFHKY